MIIISGSWDERMNPRWHLRGSKEEFVNACVNLGKRIARYRQAVMVTSDQDNTADYHVVNGIVEEIGNKPIEQPLIIVNRSHQDATSFFKLAQKFPSLFNFHSKGQTGWFVSSLMAIRENRVVVCIGGGKGTEQLGIAAIIAKKKVIPIASFGGASDKLLVTLESLRISNNENLQILRSPWTENLLEDVLKLIGLKDYPTLGIIHGRDQDWKELKNYMQGILKLPEPIVMSEEFGQSYTLTEKWENIAVKLHGAIVVATPDDIGTLIVDDKGRKITKKERKYTARARQNVWLETGWLWGALGRRHMIILCKGTLDIPSDISGIEVYPYDKQPSEKSEDICKFIRSLSGI